MKSIFHFVVVIISIFYTYDYALALPPGYCVEGIIESHTKSGSDTHALGKKQFSIKIGERNDWEMVTSPTPGHPAHGIIDQWKLAKIQNVIYYLVKRNQSQRGKASINNASGIVEYQDIPTNYEGNRIIPLWIMFLSTEYFNNIDRNNIVAFDLDDFSSSHNDFRDLTIQAHWKMNQSKAGFLDTLVCNRQNLIGINRNIIFQKPPATMKLPYKRINYEVLDKITFQDTEFPENSIYEIFHPEFTDATKHNLTLERCGVYSITTTNIKTSPAMIMKPEFDGVASVWDYRVLKDHNTTGPISYYVMDGNWPAIDSKSFRPQIQSHITNEMAVEKLKEIENEPSARFFLF